MYENSNSEIDENMQELAIIAAFLPVWNIILLNCIAELTTRSTMRLTFCDTVLSWLYFTCSSISLHKERTIHVLSHGIDLPYSNVVECIMRNTDVFLGRWGYIDF